MNFVQLRTFCVLLYECRILQPMQNNYEDKVVNFGIKMKILGIQYKIVGCLMIQKLL